MLCRYPGESITDKSNANTDTHLWLGGACAGTGFRRTSLHNYNTVLFPIARTKSEVHSSVHEIPLASPSLPSPGSASSGYSARKSQNVQG
eukprot:m.319602 g.319602  ORF g.319602 m.319602 type:complete len:90 (-) comp16446_c3_seq12:1285-1554(-)